MGTNHNVANPVGESELNTLSTYFPRSCTIEALKAGQPEDLSMSSGLSCPKAGRKAAAWTVLSHTK